MEDKEIICTSDCLHCEMLQECHYQDGFSFNDVKQIITKAEEQARKEERDRIRKSIGCLFKTKDSELFIKPDKFEYHFNSALSRVDRHIMLIDKLGKGEKIVSCGNSECNFFNKEHKYNCSMGYFDCDKWISEQVTDKYPIKTNT